MKGLESAIRRTPGLSWRVVLPFLTALLIAGYGLFALFTPAGATDVDPVFVDGNPSCSTLGYDHELKVDPPSEGEHTDGTLTVDITDIRDTSDGQVFDWESLTIPVDGVIVKGGPDANHYPYDPAAMEDEGLHAPVSPNGDYYGLSHISFCYDDPEPGNIIVEKETDPDGSNETFEFEAPWGDFDLQDGDDEDSGDLDPGTYTVTEVNIPSGWQLTSLTCDSNDVTIDLNNATVDIDLAEGETVTCTFTNTELATIIVEKQTDPDNSPQSFSFSGDVSGSISDGEQLSEQVLPGQYTSSETVPNGWELTDITCDDSDSTGDVGDTEATFNADAGETVTCTFTNTELATIIVEKQTDPDGSDETFTFTGDLAGAISDGETISADVLPDTYSSTETVPTGWDLTSIVCDDPDSSGDTNTATASFDVDAGQTVKCTFTNTLLLGSISGSKDDGQGGDGWTINLYEGTDTSGSPDATTTTDSNGDYSFSDLEPGTYTICEVLQADWEQTAPASGDSGTVTCDSGTIGYEVDLSAGEEETGYDFTNAPDIDPLSISKTVDATRVTTYEWSLDKSVSPDTWHLFDGDSATSEYSVEATRTLVSDVYAVSGTITIVNENSFDVEITGVSDVINPDGISADSITCEIDSSDVTLPETLEAGDTMLCDYEFASGDLDGSGEDTNVASVTTESGEGDNSTEEDVAYSQTIVDGTLEVDDTNGDSWTFNDSGTQTYTDTFTCENVTYDQDGVAQYTVDNDVTAALEDESELTSSASVEVNCYELQVSKDADTSFDREFEWTIDKSADPTTHNLLDGESATSTYTVAVTKNGPFDVNHAASGEITIVNPNSNRAADLTGVSDVVSPGGFTAIVDCGGATSVAAGSSLTCDWSVDLPNGDSRTNTATVTQQNYSFDQNGNPTADGTTEYTATADVIFGEPDSVTLNEINVTDTFGGAGPWFFEDSGSVNYDREFVCNQDTLGDESSVTFTVDNTATITETGQFSDATVTVNCSEQPALQVSKTVELEFDRTWDWDITKSADPTLVDLTPGETGDVDYTILVTQSDPIDSNWAISGAITIVNPADATAVVTGIEDVISQSGLDNTTATITSCELDGVAVEVPGGGSTVTMEPDDTLVCAYSADLSGGADGNNSVTVSTEGTVPGAGASAGVDFDTATINEDEDLAEIEVTDNNDGAPDPWTFTETDSVSYTLTFTCEDSGLEGTGTSSADFVNTATIEETGQSDDATVTVSCTDEPSSLEVVKTVVPSEIGPFGEDVTYEFTITNTSPDLDVTLTDWDDSLFGDLTNPSDASSGTWTAEVVSTNCALPTEPLAADGGSYSCELVVNIDGEVGDEIVNVITVNGVDELGRPLSDDDDAVVVIVGEPPVVIPEAPLAILFPLIVLAIGGGAYFVYRRREGYGQIG